MKRQAPRLALLSILLLAALLRFYRLDAQSFWNDEGNSARIAERSLDLILEGAEGDIHPPGYYLLLHTWRALFGHSEFALRSLSVVAGLCLVVFTYLLGRQVFGLATGLGAAFLAAIAPFAIYYSQEARMYALLGALSVGSTYLLLRMLTGSGKEAAGPRSPPSPRQRIGTAIAYVLTCGAGLYVQYAFPLVLIAHNIIFCLWWLAVARRSPHRWRWLAAWIVAQAGIALLYVPWLPTALASVGGWAGAGRAYALGPALLDTLRVLGVGLTLPIAEATVALTILGALSLVGLWPSREDRIGWIGVATVALYLLVPITLIFAFDLYKPAWLKFLIVVLPPFCLLVAHGITNSARWVARALPTGDRWARTAVYIVSYAGVVAALLPSTRNLYFDPTYARDNYRQIAADVAAVIRHGDGIILSAPNQWEVFPYYYPDDDVHPAPYRPAEDEATGFLNPLLDGTHRLFVLYWGDDESDPQRLIAAGLAAQAYKATDRWYGRVRLATYGVAPSPDEPTQELDADFAGIIRLLGSAVEEGPYAGDQIVLVTLFWQALTPISERYKVTLQLLDDAGHLVAQHDSEPGDGLRPTTAWEPGHAFADHYGIPIPSSLPPGQYTLIVGIYDPSTGNRLPVEQRGIDPGDHLRLGIVNISS